MKYTSILTTIALGLLAAACSSSPTEPSGTEAPSVVTPTSTAVRVGYVHRIENSRFNVGAAPSQRAEYGMAKIVGDQGAFATRPTGMVIALSNADALVRSKPALPGGAAAHDQAVRAYFVAGGIPADQIGSVEPYAAMSNSGFGAASPDEVKEGRKLEYYFSVLQRAVDGIPVADSFAWARLDEDAEPVLESVYWPEIPNAVVEQAKALQARVADATASRSMFSKMPAGAAGAVTIHHAPGVWDGAFTATATYDVDVEGGKKVHFDGDGNEVVFEHEKEGAWGKSAVTPR
jgi:hypothetical protein